MHGGYTNITIGWGLAVTMGIYLAGRISGAHLNPAVTISLAVYRDFPWRKVVPYIVAQTLGAFLAAALVYWNYLPAFQAFDPGLEKTAGIFTTFPAFPQVPFAGLLDQTIGTALLLMMILAITDERNQPPGANMGALMVGLIVVAIGMAFGGMHGYAINPARDFGPRLFTAVAGFKNNGLTDGRRSSGCPLRGRFWAGFWDPRHMTSEYAVFFLRVKRTAFTVCVRNSTNCAPHALSDQIRMRFGARCVTADNTCRSARASRAGNPAFALFMALFLRQPADPGRMHPTPSATRPGGIRLKKCSSGCRSVPVLLFPSFPRRPRRAPTPAVPFGHVPYLFGSRWFERTG